MSAQPPDTRSGALSDRDVALIERLLAGRGANVTVSDPRVSAVQNWIILSVGLGLITAGGWLASKVGELSVAVATLQAQQATVADHEQRLRQLERKP